MNTLIYAGMRHSGRTERGDKQARLTKTMALRQYGRWALSLITTINRSFFSLSAESSNPVNNSKPMDA
jgi:hypothetical protein